MIEWCASSCFSFLEGASAPDDLAREARRCGYRGLALGDRLGLYGLVRAFREVSTIREDDPSFFFSPGIRLHFDRADPVFIHPLHVGSYNRLCEFLSSVAMQGLSTDAFHEQRKGLGLVPWREFMNFLKSFGGIKDDFVIMSVSRRFYPLPEEKIEASVCVPPYRRGEFPLWLMELRDICGQGSESALSLAWPLTLSPGINELHDWIAQASLKFSIPIVATTLPLMAGPHDQDLTDLLSSIRHHIPLKDLGFLKQANRERKFLAPHEQKLHREIFAKQQTELLEAGFDPFQRSLELAKRHRFSLHELKYKYPSECIPSGKTSADYLRELTLAGAQKRYPDGTPLNIIKQLNHELTLISELGFEDYFLTIKDVLSFAESRKILFQGRGSAANSAVCFCLGLTAIDPNQINLLFERFLSRERAEPPDIDIDFEHERREEVIQNVYERYSRNRAAMVATTICFRDRMAFRESAKALGVKDEIITKWITIMGRDGMRRLSPDQAPDESISQSEWQRLILYARKLKGLPRHMGLHTGGFILSNEPLTRQCILEPASMQGRSVVPWDKDDVEFLGWMKVDLLSLGMLSVLRKAMEACKIASLADIPGECPVVYKALQRADTVGVFQIESRAQMNMLPRLAPKTFYDLVVEVAIVRPGPLQGGMVHPYLRRRQGLEPVTYDHPKLEPILAKTMGVPIFQEQVMKIAVAIAGFTPGEADELRKVMSGAWRAKSTMQRLQDKLFAGMKASGISDAYAARIYKQIEGFGEYGFPESHAASFALLTYASSWIKTHRPAEFLCALLNSQPMGFYSARSLIEDAKRHGVKVLPIDVMDSGWDSKLVRDPSKPLSDPRHRSVRLGFHLIRGFSKDEALKIETLQRQGLLSSEHEHVPRLDDLRRWGLSNRGIEQLIHARALSALDLRPPERDTRREQLWTFRATKSKEVGLGELQLPQRFPDFFRPSSEWESLARDYQSTGISLGRHPVVLLKEFFAHIPNSPRWIDSEALYSVREGARVFVIGLLGVKQKPPTAGGMTFLTLEDEKGFLNLSLFPDVYERTRLTIEFHCWLAAEAVVTRSTQVDPKDPKSVALSLRVLDLWNPLEKLPIEAFKASEPRHYH